MPHGHCYLVDTGIIEKHWGRIDVQSDVGQGTTFRIVLPVRQGAPDNE